MGVLAGVLLALVIALVVAVFAMRRHYKAREVSGAVPGTTEAASNTTVTPTAHPSPAPAQPALPTGGSTSREGAQYALHSFGSTIGADVPESPSSGEQGHSSASFAGRSASVGGGGRSGVTLANGIGPYSRRVPSQEGHLGSLDGAASESMMDGDDLFPGHAAITDYARRDGPPGEPVAPTPVSQLVSFETAVTAGGLPPIAEHSFSDATDSRDVFRQHTSESSDMRGDSRPQMDLHAPAVTQQQSSQSPPSTSFPAASSAAAAVGVSGGAAAYAAAAAAQQPQNGSEGLHCGQSVNISSWDSDGGQRQGRGGRDIPPHLSSPGAVHTHASTSSSVWQDGSQRSVTRSTPSPRPPVSGDNGNGLRPASPGYDSRRGFPQRQQHGQQSSQLIGGDSLMTSTGGLLPQGSWLMNSRGGNGFVDGMRPDEHAVASNFNSNALDTAVMMDSFTAPGEGPDGAAPF
jgi:hypothetical protein